MAERNIISLFLVFIGLMTAIDIYEDLGEGQSLKHISIEVAILIGCAAFVIYLWRTKQNLNQEVKLLNRSLELEKIEAQKWNTENKKHIEGLTQAIDAQFQKWSFSKAEKDIAYLILKGLSLKEIAVIRGTSEKTIKLQAHAIYSKSGLEGRANLSAFFLEDLFLPKN